MHKMGKEKKKGGSITVPESRGLECRLHLVILGCYMIYGSVSGQVVPLVAPCFAARKDAHLTLSSPNLMLYGGHGSMSAGSLRFVGNCYPPP